MEGIKKENMFKVLLMLEMVGWEVIQVDSCKDVWFATVIKDGEGIYMEFSDEYRACTDIPYECPQCHAKEEEVCDCGLELKHKKSIVEDYWMFKHSEN